MLYASADGFATSSPRSDLTCRVQGTLNPESPEPLKPYALNPKPLNPSALKVKARRIMRHQLMTVIQVDFSLDVHAVQCLSP